MFRTISVTALTLLAALIVIAPASADPWGADRLGTTEPVVLDARERALVERQVAQPAPDWFERFAAAHSRIDPVVDDRFAIDPTAGAVPVATTSGRDVEWPHVGIGFGLVLALGMALVLTARRVQQRPPLAR